MKKYKKLTILSFILVIFIISIFTSALQTNLNSPADENPNLKTSTTNILFNGKSYPFELIDVYDDENYTKIYTDAYLQTEYFDGTTLDWNGTVFEDQVSVVDNTEHTSPEPSDITMIEGTYDSSDNMRELDSSYSDFDSEGYGYYPATYGFDGDDIGSNPNDFTITEGGSNTIQVIAESDNHKKVVEGHDVDGDVGITNFFDTKTTGIVEWWMKASQLNMRVWNAFYPEAGNYLFFAGFHSDGTIRYYDGAYVLVCAYVINTWYHFKIEFNSDTKLFSFYLDGDLITGGDEPYVNTDGTDDIYAIVWGTSNGAGDVYWDAIGYDWDPEYDIGDNEDGDGKLNFMVESSLAQYNNPDLLSLSVTSYHGTSVSTPITANIWNYDTSSYEQMWSTTSTSVVKNTFNKISNMDNYFDGSGNLKIQYTGSYSGSDFQLNIDYLEFRITYKMDVIIYKILYINGIWRYRFKLIGSLHYTDWVVFEVVDPVPNFHAISESELTTRWLLQGSEINPLEDFQDDIASGYWDLYGVGNRFFDKIGTQKDNYLLDNYSLIHNWGYTGVYYSVSSQTADPRDIIWDGSYWWILDGHYSCDVFKYTSAWSYTETYYDVGSEDTCPEDIFWDGTNWWMTGDMTDKVYKYNSDWSYTEVFYGLSGQDTHPTGIYWDGTNWWMVGSVTDKVYKYTSSWSYTGNFYSVNQDPTPNDIFWDGTNWWMLGSSNKRVYKYTSAWSYTGVSYSISDCGYEIRGFFLDNPNWWVVGQYTDKVYKYDNLYEISKNYYGSGYAYMQTNKIESIFLKSQDYGTHYDLSSGDYFEVDFQTSSDSKIDLVLLKDGDVNKTLTLSQSENTNFDRHTSKISVDELVEFDQLKISSTFENKDNVKVYDIKTYKYTLTGDYADFYVGSKREHEIYLNPDTYNLRIYEGTHIEDEQWSWDEKINIDITIPTTGVRQYIYVPESLVSKIECRLTLFPIDGILSLTFTDYKTYVNRSYNGVYSVIPLVDPIFYADELTTVYISVYDRFDSLIGTFSEPISDFINLEIEVYQLEIINLITQKTTIDINGTHNFELASGRWIDFMLSKNYYQIGYYNPSNVYTQFLIYLDSNQIYELNMSRICNIYYTNQRMEPLSFYQFKTYINGTRITNNIFYATDGEHKGIEVKDLSDISVLNYTYTEGTEEYNCFSLILTQYSLKIFNQQEEFNHINITRDPNYYESEFSWSEWIAPTEIIDFHLFPGYYKINLTNVEDESYSYYSYTLSGDDMLLITSDNTIANAIINMQNINTTIGNQITNVEINITNQNSAINNTVVNIEINLDNVNSTLGDILLSQNIQITNIENNLTSMYVFTNTSFINLNNSIGTYFVNIENNIISINQSISNLVIGIDNNLALINGTISTLIVDIGNDLMILSTTIDTSFFFLNTTIAEIGNNITTNTILLNNSIFLTGNWINDSRIAILNNLMLINNTIMEGINQIYSSVYLINNSIYTAVIDMGTSLTLINNTISGNLSIILQQNDFLTDIYNKTMFSDLLNWTDVGYNFSIMEDRIDLFNFINNYRNQSVEVLLKYKDKIDSMIVSAQYNLEQWLPKQDVEYRLKSIATGEYLDEWKPLPENKTVGFGFYETEVDQGPIIVSFTNIVMLFFFFTLFAVIIVVLFIKFRKTVENYPIGYRTKKKKRTSTYNSKVYR